VADVVRRHNGTISVQSEVGHGSTFSIRLPLRHRAEKTVEIAGVATPAGAPSQPAVTGGALIAHRARRRIRRSARPATQFRVAPGFSYRCGRRRQNAPGSPDCARLPA
jgi:hypothetical protein